MKECRPNVKQRRPKGDSYKGVKAQKGMNKPMKNNYGKRGR